MTWPQHIAARSGGAKAGSGLRQALHRAGKSRRTAPEGKNPMIGAVPWPGGRHDFAADLPGPPDAPNVNDHERNGARTSGAAKSLRGRLVRRWSLGGSSTSPFQAIWCANLKPQVAARMVWRWRPNPVGSTSASAAGPSRPGAACSIRRSWRSEGAGLRQPPADLDRDQRHLLRLAEARELPQMGARDAGRLRLHRQGLALRHQPPGAGGGRRLDRALLRPGDARAGRQAGAGAVAVRADQEVRRGGFRRVPRAAAAQASTAGRCATWSRCGTTASARPAFIALLRQFAIPVVFADHATYPAIADVTGDFVYARLQKGTDDDRDRLSAGGAGRLGRAAGGSGPAAASRPTCRGSTRQRRRTSRRARCSPSSSTRARCARRPARWN